MAITIQDVALYIHNIRTRMPFRYGIAVMTAMPHLMMRIRCEVDGQPQIGLAADSLAPKWFTKNPNTTYSDDITEMLHVIQSAATLAEQIKTADTVFEWWQQIYKAQKRWATAKGYPPLLWNFGVSLIERAIIDAFCRANRQTITEALQTNALGIRLGDVHPELKNYRPTDLLPAKPYRSVFVRHTVGLADPLTDQEILADDRIEDGLPQSLEHCILRYGLTYFKIKVCGDNQQDMARLKQIATVLNHNVADFSFTLDGNEQYQNVEQFQAFWQALKRDPDLSPLLEKLLFVEQPLYRDVALSTETKEALTRWPDRPPIIIDESDGSIESLPTALQSGYVGTSHKNCKGIIKGIANACLLEHYRRTTPTEQYVMSGEDLANVGPIALLQDLAVMSNLGIEHVERNGHHYFPGLSMFPQPLPDQILDHHPDLYHCQAENLVTLNIQKGRLTLDSVLEAPFGLGVNLSLAEFTPHDQWQFESLGIK